MTARPTITVAVEIPSTLVIAIRQYERKVPGMDMNRMINIAIANQLSVTGDPKIEALALTAYRELLGGAVENVADNREVLWDQSGISWLDNWLLPSARNLLRSLLWLRWRAAQQIEGWARNRH